MASYNVTSSAGETIEIVPDDEWLELTSADSRGLRQWNGNSKRWIFRELWEHGAVPHNASGQASKDLRNRIDSHYPEAASELGKPTALSALVNTPINAPAIERKINGKRTYSIKLVAMPEIWHRKLIADIENDTTPIPPEPIEESPTIDPPEEPPAIEEPVSDEQPAPSIDIDISSQVAMELLTRVVEIIHAGSGADVSTEIRKLRNELVHSQGLLSQRLEENDRMRKQLRETGDELHAVKLERDGLRQRLRQTESNLTAALNGESAHAVTTEVMKRVDRIMRETPKPKGVA